MLINKVSDITLLKKIKVKHFRKLKNLDFELSENLTVICGKNGTSKSTVLGLIAQICSFDKNYKDGKEINFKTLLGKPFKSSFKDHFRFSSKFDLPGTMEVEYELYDAYFKQDKNDLLLKLYDSEDREKSRPVVRKNLVSHKNENSSRNVTHPVIYLSLRRLTPIAERPRYSLVEQSEENVDNFTYISSIRTEFERLNNRLLGKQNGNNLSLTTGTIDSAVVHGMDYDHESVSVGEDNTGQILLALYSFKCLKEQYSDYHGGILLIDELDAGLFPAAQKEIIKILEKFSKELNLQVIFTTHSPIIIQDIYEKSQYNKNKYKTIFITDTFGDVQIMNDYSWDKINADLNIETIAIDEQNSIPKINIYFEDNEAYEFFNVLVRELKVKKVINPMRNVTLGCKNYLNLIKEKVPEFSRCSIIVFDGDEPEGSKYPNTIKLPGALPPDQLLFDYFYKLPENDNFWRNNSKGFTKPVFLKISAPILEWLDLPPQPSQEYDLYKIVESRGKISKDEKGKTREKFKSFYKDKIIQSLIKGKLAENLFKIMVDSDKQSYFYFVEEFKRKIVNVMGNTYPSQKNVVASYLEINKRK